MPTLRLPVRGSRAFTLLELIVVIVILAILAAIAIPTFQRVIEKSQDAATLATLEAIGREAQALAAFDGASSWTEQPLTDAITDTGTAAGAGTYAAAKLVPVKAKVPAQGEVAHAHTAPTAGLAKLSPSGRVCTVTAPLAGAVRGSCTPVAEAGSDPAATAASAPVGGGSDPAPAPGPSAFSSPGDTNGLFYYLGTNAGETQFRNPVTSGRVVGSMSTSLFSTTAAAGAGRSGDIVHTNSGPGQWAAYDLGADSSLQLSHYTIQQRTDSPAHTLLSWSLQGSADGTSWATIHSSTASNNETGTGAWISRPVTSTTGYRHFRVLMSGKDSGGLEYLVFDEVELYGTFTAPPVVASSAPLDVVGGPGDSYVDVSFSPPATPGSYPASEYRVYVNGASVSSATGTASPVRVSGLQNGTSYTFTVRAYNGALSPESAASAAVQPFASPFVSVGDQNGVFYHLGTNKGTTTWSNPITAGKVVASSSSFLGGSLDAAADRSAGIMHTSNGAGQWLSYDLGAGASLQLSHYTIQQRTDSPAHNLLAWSLQGSADGTSWSTIHSSTASSEENGAGKWISRSATATKGYRHFRVLMTGKDSGGMDYLVVDEVELYGAFSG